MPDLIEVKLATLEDYLNELAPHLDASEEAYLRSRNERRIVERLAQVVVDSAVEVNVLLIERYAEDVPASERQSFEEMHILGAIDAHLLDRFQRHVGFRNRIVGDFDVLDNRMVFSVAKRLLDDARAYVRSVQHFMLLREGEAQGVMRET